MNLLSRVIVEAACSGTWRLGKDIIVQDYPLKCRLSVRSGALLIVGDGVYLGAGCDICATERVCLGDDVIIGSYAIIMDNDFHVPGSRVEISQSFPVYIGARTYVGAYATILKGADIGNDVTIMPGSVVSGRIMSGSTVSGCPAREI